MGAQSFSYRNFDLAGAIRCLKETGLNDMEFCAVHFKPDKDDPEFAQVQTALAESGINVPCFGVEGFGPDAAANRTKFAFAKALGIQVLTADPTPDSFGNLDALTEEFGVKIAIHNHGPGARYDKVDDVLTAVEGHSPMIGACADTGHYLRSSEQPHEVIEKLGDRLISLHLKDWKIGGDEQILGNGDMDLVAVAKALKTVGFSGPIVMEYEESPDNPVEDMKQGWANWLAACGQA
ncbi:MAG: sugar phosphate isomerase/epimerase [bacterium]|nr:sugar phosphate isomerase/epimerase [bacterium]